MVKLTFEKLKINVLINGYKVKIKNPTIHGVQNNKPLAHDGIVVVLFTELSKIIE